MTSRLLILLPVMLLAITCLVSAEEERPQCDSRHSGHFFPQPEASSGKRIQDLAQSGVLQVCTLTDWGYKWKKLSVTLDQLREERRQKAAKNR